MKGRPKLPDHLKRKTVCLKVAPDVYAALKKEKNASRTMDAALRQFLNLMP